MKKTKPNAYAQATNLMERSVNSAVQSVELLEKLYREMVESKKTEKTK